jgi:hypothetical protein
MYYLKNSNKSVKHIIIAPIIFSVIIPLVIMDLWIEIYHRICFPLYNIPCVKRSEYIKIDRHKLAYLTFLQKIYCVYCGYANGAVNYWVKIAGDTERYWCGIQHKKSKNFHAPEHHKDFAKYGDEKDFNRKYKS